MYIYFDVLEVLFQIFSLRKYPSKIPQLFQTKKFLKNHLDMPPPRFRLIVFTFNTIPIFNSLNTGFKKHGCFLFFVATKMKITTCSWFELILKQFKLNQFSIKSPFSKCYPYRHYERLPMVVAKLMVVACRLLLMMRSTRHLKCWRS